MARDGDPADRTAGPSTSARSLPRSMLVEARPKQWVKNLLVSAAPGAAGLLGQAEPLLQTIGAFVCFCLAASGTYFLNDVADVEADRLHPKKRFRPIADGEISIPLGRTVGATAIVGALLLALVINWHLAVVVASYVTLTTAYSIWLKHIPVVDVVTVAAGFVLRAIAGAAAVGVPISNWFFIVASFGSLFMVVGKRRAEANEMGESAPATRSTLGLYSGDYLIQLQTVAMSVVLVGYCLWAFEKAHLADVATSTQLTAPLFQMSIVPFALAVFRYAFLVDTGHGGAPEEIVISDRSIQLMILGWAALFAIGVYLA